MKLKLVLKYKWYDFIETGIKKHEYRSVKPSIVRLLFKVPKHYTVEQFTKQLIEHPADPLLWQYLKPIEDVVFYRGYSSDRKQMQLKVTGIEIGTAKPEWSDNWQGNVFIIKLGKIITNNTNNGK
jgi:hypothetical protein